MNKFEWYVKLILAFCFNLKNREMDRLAYISNNFKIDFL
jgi:hypothetical protein